jgi:hypothetical protein
MVVGSGHILILLDYYYYFSFCIFSYALWHTISMLKHLSQITNWSFNYFLKFNLVPKLFFFFGIIKTIEIGNRDERENMSLSSRVALSC